MSFGFEPVRKSALLAVAILGSACASQTERQPAAPSWQSIAIETIAVALDPADPTRSMVDGFEYAGGLELRPVDTDRVHELSDIAVVAPDHLLMVSDQGVLVDMRLRFDEAGDLIGLTEARLMPVVGEDGLPLAGLDADAEGVALLPNGDRLVSLERRHRILRYPADGGLPTRAPSPDEAFPANAGMEPLSPDPEHGPDAYVVGGENSGATWTCRLSEAACIEGPTVEKDPAFGLVAIQRLPTLTAWLLRAYDPERGSRIRLEIVRDGSAVGLLGLSPPLTVDNFEGLGCVPLEDGRLRFYLVSDDNDNASQRTLLLAFDWTPPADPRP